MPRKAKAETALGWVVYCLSCFIVGAVGTYILIGIPASFTEYFINWVESQHTSIHYEERGIPHLSRTETGTLYYTKTCWLEIDGEDHQIGCAPDSK